jgi:hypothetical protein
LCKKSRFNMIFMHGPLIHLSCSFLSFSLSLLKKVQYFPNRPSWAWGGGRREAIKIINLSFCPNSNSLKNILSGQGKGIIFASSFQKTFLSINYMMRKTAWARLFNHQLMLNQSRNDYQRNNQRLNWSNGLIIIGIIFRYLNQYVVNIRSFVQH